MDPGSEAGTDARTGTGSGPDVTTLPPRTFLGTAGLVAAGVTACVALAVALRAIGDPEPWAPLGAGLLLVVVVVLPSAWAGRRLLRQRVDVLPDRVRLRHGDRVVREVRLDELASVRAADTVSRSSLGGARALPALVLRSERTGILVSRHQVLTLAPLLEVLAPRVQARPGLITDERQRETFARYLRECGPNATGT